jgi:hypothetical protein
MLRTSSIPLSAALLLASGCLEAAEPLVDPFEDARADGDAVALLDAQPGESLFGLSVEASNDPSQGMVVVRLHLRAGDSLVAAMRAETSSLNPFLLLRDRDGAIAMSERQALLPMALEMDAVVAHTAASDQEVLLFATGGPNFETGGRFRLDLVGLGADPGTDLGVTHAGLRALQRELRRMEPDVIDLLELGVFAERADGLVEIVSAGFTELPLAKRAWARNVEATVNYHRTFLFDEYARSGDAGASAEAVAAAAAEVWAQARREF